MRRRGLGGCKYLFSYQKYETRHVTETWPVAGTCFPTQNMKRKVYLRPLPIYSRKYEARRPGRLQVPVILPKIWRLACTWGLAGHRYLFSYPKYEARDVPATVQQKYEAQRPGPSQVPVFQPKIWSARYTCGSYLFIQRKYEAERPGRSQVQYLLSYPKYEAWHVPEAWPVAGTCFPTQNLKRGVYLRRFATPLVKIVTRGQQQQIYQLSVCQLQVCQQQVCRQQTFSLCYWVGVHDFWLLIFKNLKFKNDVGQNSLPTFFFFFKSCLTSIYNLSVMTDPPKITFPVFAPATRSI